MADTNSMQATMGLSFNTAPQQQPRTPSPGETSLQLMESARNQMMAARQTIGSAITGMSQQFQANYDQLKSSTYNMNPQMAQALQASRSPYYGAEERAANPFGTQGGMLPSPLQMTPAETGVFRPRAQGFNFQALPPITMPSWGNRMLGPTGLGVMLPPPMFQSEMERQQTMNDQLSMMSYAQASQIPGVLGTGMGFGAAAMAGARMGRGFGRYGSAIGAGIGALGAGLAGIPSAIGSMADTITGIPYETIQMGASLQNSTRGFITAGPGLSPAGRGLGREAARDLASGIRDMASQDSMFNRQDLMSMVNQGGQAGLFDMAQSVPEIKNKLRETMNTVKEFMSLTNDPDLTSVIRQMGQMQQMGMTQGQMVQAAQGMRAYAKQAGTTIQGLKDIGGTPGSYAFQQMGLTAGQGFMYGNYSAASTRNMLATGNLSPRDLALMGGVSGMTQRDIMGQAAFAGMPLFGAMNAKYGAKGWDAATKSQGWQAEGGAAGMVTDAYKALSAGVQEGGVGAMATFFTSQRQIADKALAKMTPEEMMAQRYNMAMNTGKMFGLSGMQALSFGANTMYGKDQAEQMTLGAGTPGFFQMQMAQTLARSQEAAMQQQGQIGTRDFFPSISAPGFLNKFLGGVSQLGGGVGDTFARFSDALADLPLVGTIPTGMNRTRFGDASINSSDALLRLQDAKRTGKVGLAPVTGLGADRDSQLFQSAFNTAGTLEDPAALQEYLTKNVGKGLLANVQALASAVAEDVKSSSGSGLQSIFRGDWGKVESDAVTKPLLEKAEKLIPNWKSLPASKKQAIFRAAMGAMRGAKDDTELQKALRSVANNSGTDMSNVTNKLIEGVNAAQAQKIDEILTGAGLDATSDFFQDDSSKALKGFLGDTGVGGADLMLMMGAMAKDTGNKQKYFEAYKKAGGTITDFEKYLVKGTQLRQQVGKKGNAGEISKGLQAFANSGKGETLLEIQPLLAGAQLAGAYATSDVLPGLLAPGSDISAVIARGGNIEQSLAGLASENALEQAGGKDLVSAAKRIAAGKGSDADLTLFRKVALRGTARGKTAERSNMSAGGEEAARAERGMNALGSLDAQTFNEGAGKLVDAADLIIKHLS
jgi:hypothetical protein